MYEKKGAAALLLGEKGCLSLVLQQSKRAANAFSTQKEESAHILQAQVGKEMANHPLSQPSLNDSSVCC